QANPDGYSVAGNSAANVFRPLTNDVLNLAVGSLSIVSVSPTNGTATISGTNVLFTPTPSFSGTATIGYTITDGFGGTSTSLITVTIPAPASIPLSLGVAGSTLTFNWTDPTFSLQSSTNVAGPYTTIPGATTGFSTNTTAAPTMFFRLKF
ncbi:MAG: Ig-like domain-containing protein, partial [Verrucomicrobiota bacterium]